MVKLPYEIWLQITSYLPYKTIWSLRCLNSSLLNIALDRRYKRIEVSTKSLDSRLYAYKFLGYRDKNIAKRIRTVCFIPTNHITIPGKRLLSSGSIMRGVQTFLSFKSSRSTIIKTIEGFTNASSLGLQLLGHQQKSFQKAIPVVFHTTLRICSSHLHTLLIRIPIPYCSEVLDADIYLPHLTTLKIGTSRFDLVPLSNTIAPAIVPFVNRHRLTLKWFALTLGTETDGSSPFIALGHITSLKSFAVWTVQLLTGHGPASQFLNLHSATLQDLTIIPYEVTGSGVFIARISKDVTMPFPNLRKLDIAQPIHIECPRQPEYDLGETACLIRRCASSLVTLLVQNVHLTMDDLSNLFNHEQCPEQSYTHLRYLDIRFWFFTPAMLDILASCLPNLQLLFIKAHRLKPRDIVENHVDDEKQFSFQMVQRNYARWKLEEFEFSYQFTHRPIRLAIGAAAMAVAMMNSLRSFNGMPVAEYISQGQLAELII